VSIEIEILNGDHSWQRAEELLDAVWPPAEMGKLFWGHVKWAHADLRVLIETEDGELACHAGIHFRTVTWNGQKVHIGGIGGVATHPAYRRRGFCEPHNFEFYQSRGWQPFAGAIYAEQPEGRIRFEAMTPFVFDLKRRAPTLGTIDMCGMPW